MGKAPTNGYGIHSVGEPDSSVFLLREGVNVNLSSLNVIRDISAAFSRTEPNINRMVANSHSYPSHSVHINHISQSITVD